MFSSVPPVLTWSILPATPKTAVGPRRSAPCTGLMPSDTDGPRGGRRAWPRQTSPKYTWQVVGSISTR